MGQTVSYLLFISAKAEVGIAPNASYLWELLQSGWNDGIQSKRVLRWLNDGDRRRAFAISVGDREISSLPDGSADRSGQDTQGG